MLRVNDEIGKALDEYRLKIGTDLTSSSQHAPAGSSLREFSAVLVVSEFFPV